MLGHALAASDLERRRIAADLHDGLVQSLSALSYSLPAVRSALPETASAARRVLLSVEGELQTEVRALRQMMTAIYPADLSTGDLRPAVEDLADRAREAGLTVVVSMDAGLVRPSAEAAQMVYRIVREGLRNVVRHAQASRVTVTVALAGGMVEVAVDDDGWGSDGVPSEEGHVGIRLLADAVADMGGRLVFERSELGGARLWATFPLALGAESALSEARRTR